MPRHKSWISLVRVVLEARDLCRVSTSRIADMLTSPPFVREIYKTKQDIKEMNNLQFILISLSVMKASLNKGLHFRRERLKKLRHCMERGI